jgi:ribosomal protein S18 acetylase RimI-like enzyme
MVDQQNYAAIRLYRNLGMSYRGQTAAYVTS